MVKIWCLFLLFFIHEAKAQYNVVKADLLPIFVPDPRVFRPSYERSFGKYVSGVLSFETGRYGYAQIDSNKLQVMETTGWGLVPEFRIYPFGNKTAAPFGFFAGPHFLYRRLKEHYIYNSTDITTRATQSGFGLNAGYKLGFLNRFCLDFLVGYTIGSGKWAGSAGDRSKIDPQYRFDLSDFKNYLRVEVALGMVFPKIISGKNKIEIQNKLKEIATDIGTDTSYAQLVIYRPKSFEGETVEYDLFINDSLTTHVKNGSYFTYEILTSGLYTISATTEDKVSVQLELKKGKIYYLECTIGAGTAIGLPRFRLVPERKAEPRIRKIMKRN